MKRIALVKLDLKDFQGGTFTLDAEGAADVYVYGRNSAGKTRLASAISWLLFGKDSLGRTDFAIKNLDADGTAASGLEHSVHGVFDVDGQTITLRKVYKEIWSKKRGQPTATFSGNTVDFYVNGVPVKEKDYVAQIAELAGEEQRFRLLTSPTVFPAMHWQKQRALLLEVCGDLTDSDVIATDAQLAPLVDLIAKYRTSRTPFEDLKKVIVARRSEINKELERLPVRIDEQRRSLPDVSALGSEQAILDAIRQAEEELAGLRLQQAGVNTGGAIATLSKEIAGVRDNILRMRSAHSTATMQEAQRVGQQIADVETALYEVRRRVSSIDSEIALSNTRLKTVRQQLDGLRQQWQDVDQTAFVSDVVDTCAACGQSLPAHSVAAAREKALAEFNRKKATALETITRDGESYGQQEAALEGAIAKLTADRDAVIASSPDHTAQLAQLVAERDRLRMLAADYSGLGAAHAELGARLLTLEAELAAEKSGRTGDASKIQAEILGVEARLREQKDRADMFPRRAAGERRIAELMADEKRLAVEFETLEHQLFLCEQFTRTKVNLLTDRINSRFEVVRFKLFTQLVNGGIDECCEIMVNGVPYNSGLNNAARIQAGCDVIRTLQKHYGMTAPLIVDNRESVTDLPAMDCQVISLVVSPDDAVLRVAIRKGGQA